MNNQQDEQCLRRVLLAMDGPIISDAGLQAAVELAQHLRAELHGLFIEDIDLIRLAELPFSMEVTTHSGSIRELSTNAVERSMRTKAEAARKGLRSSAERARVHWSFQIVRGRVINELLSVAEEADVLIVWSSHEARRRRLMTRREKASEAEMTDAPVLAVFDGSTAGERVLRVAATMALVTKRSLHVLIVAIDPDEKAQRLARAQYLLLALDVHAQFRTIADQQLHTLVRGAKEQHAASLVISVNAEMRSELILQQISEQLRCPLFIVH